MCRSEGDGCSWGKGKEGGVRDGATLNGMSASGRSDRVRTQQDGRSLKRKGFAPRWKRLWRPRVSRGPWAIKKQANYKEVRETMSL